ncbi:prohead protease/major capsid protein fusion protein [Caldanaerobius polysaccharolyticus]|uniref:prohead protease/major capsid protein fusion protein n=1 Tax=Caldanaerobius polysaccharolyticus TaxID=44256 RepID=UPI00047C97B6|nr:prohead protease/major capsid protein fusion protein [Caldanaerobius polysaccharolyticus]
MPDKPKTGIQQNRTIEMAVREVKAEERRVTVSFSSEQPVDRWYGIEILQHDEGNVNLERLNSIGVALFNHNRDYVIGRIENARLAADEKRAYADIVFDTDPEADLIYQKVKNGTLKGVSVGYTVDVWEEVAAGKTSSNGRFLGPAYVATKWTPLEISIVSVPADDTVGVGREVEEPKPIKEEEKIMGEENRDKTLQVSEPVDLEAEREKVIQAERQRVSEITALCRDFEIAPDEYIKSGATIDQVRAKILEKLKAERKPSAAPVPDVRIEKEEADKFREAATDAILLRSGIKLDKPADGARDLRGMKLRDLAIECLIRAGRSNAHRLDNDTLFREALTPDSQFTSILSNAVNKSMATAYKAATTTYEAWTSRGSNPDFKAATVYQISEAGELLPMTQSGEFKFDEMTDQGVTKAVATFGRSFGMTRQALINDDIGILTRVPEAYVRAARRGINKLVYKMLGSNPTIYDGKTLFHAQHNNLASTAGAIGTDTIGEGRKAMRKQKNLGGKETLNISPAFLIVPAALETVAQKFLMSTADPNQANPGVVNIFRNSLNLVVDAELDDYSETAWYLAASPSDIDTIEVTYLNGNDMPILESQVGFDFLGIKWRIYIDYGVTVLDYRGLYKNPGA